MTRVDPARYADRYREPFPVFIESVRTDEGTRLPIADLVLASGTVASLGSEEVTVMVDATARAPGTYTYDIDVISNDPDRSEVTVGVDLTVNDVNDPPIAEDDSYTVLEGTTLDVDETNGVFANDSDLIGMNAPVLSVTQSPASGTLLSDRRRIRRSAHLPTRRMPHSWEPLPLCRKYR